METKHILITGVSRGIGRELVRTLANTPHHIYGISRNEKKLAELSEELEELSAHFHPLPFDILSGDLRELTERMGVGHLDVLINNAGALISKPFEEISMEEFDHIYKVNVQTPFRLTQAMLPLLKKSDPAHVVNIGSMGGVNGTVKFSGLSAYSSSKGALSILSECLAEELKETSVRVNCLALGSANTEMLQEAFPGFLSPVSASEMAAWIAHFALNSSRLVNGKTIPVSSSTP